MSRVRFYQDEKFASLITGYKKFRERYFSENVDVFEKLVSQGQHPKIMIISCGDSRIDLSKIFNCSPGDIFVVRNIANLVPPCHDEPRNYSMAAALEFAVRDLKVEHIIILGHSHCGGIKALLASKEKEASQEEADSFKNKFINHWVEIAKEVRDSVQNISPQQQAKIGEEQALLLSLRNLKTYSWINAKVKENQLALHAWRYVISQGIIQNFNPDLNYFEDLKEELPRQNCAIASKL